MRKITALLAMAILAGVSTGRADVLGLSKITADGSIEILGQQTNNESDLSASNDHRGNTLSRVRVGLNAEVTKDVKARVEAVRNGATTGGTNQYGAAGRPTSANNELDNFKFQNAYLDLSNFLSLDAVRLGRQYLGRENDAMAFFGVLPDDAMNVTALDALSISKKIGPVNLWAVTGKRREDDTIPGTSGATDAGDVVGDQNDSWVTLSSDELLDLPMGKLPLEIGYYNRVTANTSAANDNQTLVVYDLRAGWTGLLEDKLSLGVEYAFNGGQDNNGGVSKLDYKGDAWILNAELGDKDNGWGAHVNYANASGDNNATDSQIKNFVSVAGDYRFGEILSNTLGLTLDSKSSGLNVASLGGSYVLPMMDNKVTIAADLFMAKANKVAAGVDKKLGNEADLSLSYKHSNTVGATVGFAMLQSGDGLSNAILGTTNKDPEDVTKAYAKLNVKFGGR